MTRLVFSATVVCELLLAASLLYSTLRPADRIWPPPRMGSWKFWCVWTLTTASFAGALAVASLDWNSFTLDEWIYRALGVVLFVSGLGFALWAVAVLGLGASSGIRGPFVTRGPYRYSRNPQYVGDMAVLLGIALISNSQLTLVLSLIGSLCFA